MLRGVQRQVERVYRGRCFHRMFTTSLIATCERLGIDPLACLRDIFPRISTHPKNRLAELSPASRNFYHCVISLQESAAPEEINGQKHTFGALPRARY